MNLKFVSDREYRRTVSRRPAEYVGLIRRALYATVRGGLVFNSDHPAWRTAVDRFDVPPAGAVPADRWSSLAQALAGLATGGDAGLGDVVDRITDPVTALRIRRRLTGRRPESRDSLNTRYPVAAGGPSHDRPPRPPVGR